MRQWITTGVTVILSLGVGAGGAFAVPDLFDWGFNLDGTTHCNLGPCDFDFVDPGLLPASINTGGFDFNSGLGTLGISFAGAGNHAVDVFLDHAIDDGSNGFFNEFGDSGGAAAAGQTWEIDGPLTGDIFDNFAASTLDNLNGVPMGSEEDVAMALGWDFALGFGQSALLSFVVSDVQPIGFFLSHTDPDSVETIFFSSTIDIQGGTQVAEPGTLFLLASGFLGLATHHRKRRKRWIRRQ